MSKKWVTSVVLAAGLFVSGISVAEANTSKPKHTFNATVKSATITKTGSPPASGSSQVQAGTLTSSLGGGAGTSKQTFAAGTGPGKFAFTGTNKFFTGSGSFNGSIKGTGGLQSNGTITFAGTETVTGGTGRYAGARGKLTFTGVLPSVTATVVTLKFKGTITY
jgi:hypothetical protein